MEPVLLSTSYLPNLHYFFYVLNAGEFYIEQWENYQKQTYRNRCSIYSANGRLDLVIPLQKQSDKELIKDKKISYAENWPAKHWTALVSAYKNAPYFDYFEEEFRYFYENEFELLFDFNTTMLEMILKLLRVKKDIRFTDHYEKEVNNLDLRAAIHPKIKTELPVQLNQPYYQVFSGKHGFIPNLSVIDLLFNKGLETRDYLAIEL